MKKILVPTDFSDCARVAEDFALLIAKKCQAEIHFLHLLVTPVDWVELSLEKEKLFPETKAQIVEATNELNKLVKKAEESGIKAEKFLVYNKGQEEINRHIKHHGHDFIIMGSHGTKGIKEFIGSNTQKVVRYSDVPVLVVKDKPIIGEIKNMVFASSFEDETHWSFLEIIEFSNLMKLKTHLLYVNTPFLFKETDEAESKMNSFLQKYPNMDCSVHIYNAFTEERGIQKFAKSINSDLISLTTHGRTGFQKLMSHSIAEYLVNHSDIPVLIVKIN